MVQIEAILGKCDQEVGSGICIFFYILRDGSEIWVSTGDCVHLGWIKWRKEGAPEQLLFEAKYSATGR
jgi:hypothetical protein